MTSVFSFKLRLATQKTNINAQKIYSLALET